MSVTKEVIAKTLRWAGLLKFDLLSKRVASYPESTGIQDGTFVVVEDGGIRKWGCMRCPGGCGKDIALSLNPSRRPRWSVTYDWWMRPSVEPSVHQLNDCGCHFWIRNGIVDWCRDGRPQQLQMAKHKNLKRYGTVHSCPSPSRTKS